MKCDVCYDDCTKYTCCDHNHITCDCCRNNLQLRENCCFCRLPYHLTVKQKD